MGIRVTSRDELTTVEMYMMSVKLETGILFIFEKKFS